MEFCHNSRTDLVSCMTEFGKVSWDDGGIPCPVLSDVPKLLRHRYWGTEKRKQRPTHTRLLR